MEQPIRLLEVEVGETIAPLPLDQRATKALVRLHGRPIGIVDLDPNSDDLEGQIVDQLGEEILASPVSAETARARRRAFLERAPLATVVVATRERPDQLAVCLDSLLELDYSRFEVIVVDNSPRTSHTADLIRARYAHRGIRYVQENRPGLAAAHNRGFAEAHGWVIAFTDDDVVVDPNWLLELARGFEAAKAVGCVTGLILPAELDTPAQLLLERYARFGKGFARKVYDQHENRPNDRLFPYTAGLFGSGANMAFSAEALRRMGGFDPATGAGTRARGGDDLAAFFSVVSMGYTLVYEPAALIRHHHRREADLERQLFDYGAGLTAYLTKVVFDEPSRILDLVGKVPRGLAHGLWRRSPRNESWHGALPRELIRAERRGMLYGPVGYIAARWGRA